MFVGPKTVLELLGVIPLLTGLVGHCPIYGLFGLSTCPRVKQAGKKSGGGLRQQRQRTDRLDAPSPG